VARQCREYHVGDAGTSPNVYAFQSNSSPAPGAGCQNWYTSTCPGSRISLFGYSEGAWIVNVWELKHPAEAGHIYSAALIGDPCYVDAIGNKGPARLFTGDCGPADDYIVGETNIQPTNSDCLLLDPVCGAGYLGTPAAQLAGAGACYKLGNIALTCVTPGLLPTWPRGY
jgi:Cutinase